MANKAQTNSHSYFFVVAYPSILAKDIDVIIDMKHQGVQPLKKLLEKILKQQMDIKIILLKFIQVI